MKDKGARNREIRKEIKKMKRYRCPNCEIIYVGWGVDKVCRKCGGKLELVIEEQLKGANKK